MTTLTDNTPRTPDTTRSNPSRHVLAFAAYDFRRIVRMIESTFFVVALPAAMYVMFGAMSPARDAPAGYGNVAAYIMVSMAVYGAVTATSSIAGSAAVERMQGWGRQLALTNLSKAGYFLGKVLVGLAMAFLAVLVVFVLGALTGAEMDSIGRWLAALALTVLASLPFAFYGLAAALLFRSEAAVGAASGMLVVLSFLGNVFMPLSGGLLEFARFTPMYGVVQLARWPLQEGAVLSGGSGGVTSDPLWFVLASVLGWTVIFAGICLAAGRRSTSR